MAATQPRSPVRKFLKLVLITAAVFLLATVGLHIWFVNNARGALKRMVTQTSHGKLKLELSSLSFDFISNKLQIRGADLSSVDSSTQPATYHIRFRKLTVKIPSLWPLLLQRKLLLDSIKLHDPEIEVFQWRHDTASRRTDDELSISQEMGKLYNSMLDGLDALGIRRIVINNARLSLVNKMKPGSQPIVVSNIYFNLFRTPDKVKRRDQFIQNEHSVDLRTTNQSIALPGGIHHLSFKSFHLELFEKRIELDSCTLVAKATDTSKSNYSIFFKKLLLLGVDFDAMYRLNLIKADSVYCEEPLFDINIRTSGNDAAKAKSKERPDPARIVKELTGDLDLAFVGVKDAGIHINITGKKERSLFNSNKDDFEMLGLRINSDSSSPVQVERFDMLVRDYHLYNEDSSAAYSFDSIHFLNNKIVLNNFTVATASTQAKTRDRRDFRIPYFELTGLDWYQLIFEENLRAQAAVLRDPVINYQKHVRSTGKKTKLFASLQTLDNLMTLDKLNIINGQINMQLAGGTSINLQDVNLGLYSNRLLKSNDKKDLRNAIELLSFSHGVIKLKDLTARLQNIRYSGSHLVHADQVLVNGRGGKIKANLSDVYLDNMMLDEDVGTIEVDGVRWKKAIISIQSSGNAKAGKGGNLQLKNISGNNTQFNFSNGKATVSTFVQSIKLASLVRNGNRPISVAGLHIGGTNLSVKSGAMNINAASYNINSDGASSLSTFQLDKITGRDTLLLEAPAVHFTADINGMLQKDMHLPNLALSDPHIRLSKWDTVQAAGSAPTSLRIDKITASRPLVDVRIHKHDSVTIISLPRSDNGRIALSGVKINAEGTQIGGLSLQTTSATFIKPNGDVLGVENGNAEVELSDIRLSKSANGPAWHVLVDRLSLKSPKSLTLGKNKNSLLFEQVAVGNLNLSSDYVGNFKQLLKFNLSAWLQAATGYYKDSNTTLQWYNASYNAGTRTLSLDSFNYHPTQPRDSVIARSAYQTDYITFRSGAIQLTDFNLEQYEKDSAVVANTINIAHPVITVYRDKLPPFMSGVIKPLPVDLLRRIGLPVSVQRVNFTDGLLSYSEKHPKTRVEGTLLLTKLNVRLSNIKNYGYGANDSLSLAMDAYLMDSALINLRVKESYTDSLGGFLMTLRMKPTSLSFLNPVIAPLSNVIITSGRIDSFYLRAIGREDLSLGEMKMFYHGLKIKLVKDGEQGKSSFLGNVASFLANTFIIHKNNEGRTGLVYFRRLQDRSFFNYIVKMTFSGMATSIGVKKNRKYMKLYQKELQQRSLPPIEME